MNSLHPFKTLLATALVVGAMAIAPAGLGAAVCTHAQTPEAILAPKAIGHDDLTRCEELGAALAAGMAMGVF